MDKIYLDYNASTPIDAEVARAMAPLLEGAWGNPSSLHWASLQAGEGCLPDGKNTDSRQYRCDTIPDRDDQRRKRGEQSCLEGCIFFPVQEREPHHHLLDRASVNSRATFIPRPVRS